MTWAPPGWTLVPGDSSGLPDFDRPSFNGKIDNFGEQFDWEKRAECPCRGNTQTDQPDPLCTICGGSGDEFYDSELIRGVIERPDIRMQLVKQGGVLLGGEVNITFRAETPVGFRHRLTMKDAAIDFSEVVERASGTTQRLRFIIATRKLEYRKDDGSFEDRTFEYDVMRLSFIDGSGVQQVLEKGIDFDVTEAGWIDWSRGDAKGTAPPVDTPFSVSYWILPQWQITSLSPFALQTSYQVSGVVTPVRMLLPFTLRAMLVFFDQAEREL